MSSSALVVIFVFRFAAETRTRRCVSFGNAMFVRSTFSFIGGEYAPDVNVCKCFFVS